jgi:S-adenosylmethionine decarboxylase
MNNVSRSNKLKPQLSRHCLGTVITKNPQKLYDSDNFIIKIQEILDTYDVQCIGKLKHDFSNKSFTCLIGLAESHISVHTWPEKFAVQLDVFLCNYVHDNTDTCRNIFDDIVEYFEPSESNETIIHRI